MAEIEDPFGVLADQTHAEHTPKSFQPWHKPRKQWVRRNVLHRYTRELIRAIRFPNGPRYFRYLSLPGDDLLDIRVLEPLFAAQDIQMHYTGFNTVGAGSAREIQMNIAENEVKALDGVSIESEIHLDRLVNVGNSQSLAWRKVRNGGPFHAINIDLCGHAAFRPERGEQPAMIDAIAEILKLQLDGARHPWLFFLATRVDPDHVERRAIDAFIKAIEDNLASSANFGGKLAELMRSEGEELRRTLNDPRNASRETFGRLFTLGFGKWMLRYLGSGNPKANTRLMSSCRYSVAHGQPDMITMAFRCDPVFDGPVDQYGLALGDDQAAAVPEEQAAHNLANRLIQMADIDALLAEDGETYKALALETEELLTKARYRAGDYKAWLTENDPLSGFLTA